MAENNNYEVNVTLDDFNAFITAEKVVDENNQPLNDYVCNVTYANLKDGQIDEIGVAIETAIEKKLPEAALSGSYNDLDDTPKNNEGKRQGFHEVAFTGEYNILEHKPELKDLAFLNTVPYSKVDEAPSLINQPFIYDEENEQYTDEKAPFDRIAFTGNYEDLKNKPILFDQTYDSLINAPGIPNEGYTNPDDKTTIKTFHKIAFSGDYRLLENIPDVFPSKINIDIFSNATSAQIRNIGFQNLQINNYANINTQMINENNELISVNLKEQLNSIIMAYFSDNLLSIKINGKDTLITSIETTVNILSNNIEILYAIIHLEPDLITNYNSNRSNLPMSIDDITTTYHNRYIIVDNEYNVLYSIYE